MTILNIKNSVTDSSISARELPYWNYTARERGIMSEADVERIMAAENYLYLSNTNQLILTLEPSAEEVEMASFRTDIGDSPNQFKLYFRNRDGTSGVREWDYWNMYRQGRDTSKAVYRTVSRTELRIEMTSEALTALKSEVSDLEFGILVIPIKFRTADGHNTEIFYGLKISTNEPFSVPIFPGLIGISPEVDVENEYTTPYYSFESFHIPKLSCSFIYNFYEIEEENYDVISERDYGGMKLSDIPKYVELRWDPSPRYIEFAITSSLLVPPPVRFGISEDSSVGSLFLGGFVFSWTDEDESGEISREGTRTATDAEVVYGSALPSESAYAADVGRMAESGFRASLIETEEIATSVSIDGIAAGVDSAMIGAPRPGSLSIPWLKTGYVGYSIQKERYDEVEQEFVPVEIFIVNDRLKTRFIDWKIAYGEVYRYKIRSVFRFVNKNGLSLYQDSDQILDTREEFSRFETGISPRGSESYYYDSKFSQPCEAEIIEERKPDSPYNIQIFPCSRKNEIFISWSQKNTNRDVAGFNVYRKQKGKKNFEKLNSSLIDIRASFWIDSLIEKEVRYTYAIEAIDIHDNFSNLSAQFSAMTKVQNVDLKRRCEAPVLFERWPGETFDGAEQPIQRMDNLVFFEEKMKMKINPAFLNLERTDPFLLKVTSLDTNIKKEIPVNFKVRTIYHRAPRPESRLFPRVDLDEFSRTRAELLGLGLDIEGPFRR